MGLFGELLKGALNVAESAVESVANSAAGQNAEQAQTAAKASPRKKKCDACAAKKRGAKLYNKIWKAK